MTLYPPDALVRFTRRFLIRSIRPGRERTFKRLFAFWSVYLPLFGVFLVAWFGLSDPSLKLMLGPACAWMGGATIFFGQAAVLSEESSPLRAAWLRVASLAATVLGTVAFACLAHVWLGWAGVVGALILLAVTFVADAYRVRRWDSE